MGDAAPLDHLVHGMGTELEAPTWPAITGAEAEAVLRRFPEAGRLIALCWHSPRPFSAAALVETERGAFLLKRHHHSVRTPAALAQEHAFMAHLRTGLRGENGAWAQSPLGVPQVMASSDGTGAIARGPWTYELHRRAPGMDLYREQPSWTPFLSHAHAYAAGVALGRTHRAAQGFAAPARGGEPLVASFTILPARDPLAAAERYVAARPALAAFLADRPWRHELARLFDTLDAGLAERLAGQPALWTHNDWHPSNLLWTPEGAVSTVFDFGLSTRTCALHDLATAIERTAVPWLALRGDRLDELADPHAALALLAGYRTVLPLGADDIDTIARLLPLVHVEFALSEIDYFAGIVGDGAQAGIAWSDYLLGHADWFVTAAGHEFMHAIAEGAGT